MTQYGRQACETLHRYSLAPKKRFGQNFLVHKRTAEAIVNASNTDKNDTVVEVGVGLGALTLPLAKQVSHVFGFEIDSGLVRFHKEQNLLPKNVTVIHDDILNADFSEIMRDIGNGKDRLKIIANLPYSISNPFIFKLIDNARYIHTVTVMLQKEVALRLSASPGTKEYGIPTILVASCATVENHFLIRPEEFYPRPQVDSMVISLHFHHRSPRGIDCSESYDRSLLKEIVRTTFHQRRKTIENTLKDIPRIRHAAGTEKKQRKKIAGEALKKAGISPSIRPEQLEIRQYIALTRVLSRQLVHFC